jgi:4-amino-4-deoxy-L-arabinose transferase-like glycosyltransferase
MLSGAIAVTAWLGYTLLARTPSFAPGVGDLELVAALLAASALLATRIKIPSVAPAAVVAGVAALMLGPVAYDLQTVASAYSGGDPTAGPALRDGFSGPGPAGAGADSQLVAYLEANQGGATWLVAVNSANTAAPLELASGKAVLAMGGFSGSDPAPTLAQLRALVASGKLRYVLLGAGGGRFAGGPPPGFLQASGGGPPPPLGGGSTPAAIQSWVSSACKTVDAAGVSNLYDCAGAA